MITRIIIVIFIFILRISAMNIGGLPSSLGDARFAGEYNVSVTNTANPGMVEFTIPHGEYDSVTFVMWLRMSREPVGIGQQITTCDFICPEPINRTGHDILEGGAGFPDGTNVIETLSFPSLEFAPYTELSGGGMPYGAYTVSGWSSNELTITIGGVSANFGPGSFTRNMAPSSSSGLSIVGNGNMSVGISRCHLHQFFGNITPVTKSGNYELEQECQITNEIKLISFEFSIDETNFVERIRHYGINCSTNMCDVSVSSVINTGITKISSRGMFRMGIGGFIFLNSLADIELFDWRFFGRKLSDWELERIKNNGMEEINRRGISQWKYSSP